MKEMIINVLKKEGMYSDVSFDKGGKTMYGITESLARKYGYKGDMKKMPLKFAIELYEKLFWRKEFESLKKNIAEFLFDCHINHGYKGMSLILQRAINALTKDNVVEDGYAGVKTYKKAKELNPDRLFILLNACRCQYYLNICQKNETQEKFIFGWLKNRIEWKKVGGLFE